jgi:YVTN family beta-propeller protein
MIVPASLEGKAELVAVGDMPYYVAITPDSKTAYVSNHMSHTVSVISIPERKKRIDDVAVGASPVGIALTNDGETLYVANYGGGNVSVVSTATHKVVKTLTAGSQPYWVEAHPKRAFVVVSNYGSDGLDVFHVDGKHTRIAFKNALTQVYLSPSGDRMFTTAWGHAAVGIIE